MLEMDQSALGWIHNTAKRNFWRVKELYDFEDLVQDGQMVFYRVAKTYPDRDTPKKLMPAFKIAFINHINTLSCKRTYKRELEGGLSDLDECGDERDMADLLIDAPPDVRKVLEFVVSPEISDTLKSPYRIYRDNTRQTTQDKVCHAFGLDPKGTDVMARVRAYLEHKELPEPPQQCVREKFIVRAKFVREKFIRRREKLIKKPQSAAAWFSPLV